VAKFGEKQETEFVTHLRRTDADTLVSPLMHMEELELSLTGETKQDAYRYTSVGFAQICQMMISGLSTLLPNTVDENRSGIDDSEQHDLVLAINVFNSYLALRGKQLLRMRVVRHRPAKLIHGIVGAQYTFTENADVYAVLAETVRRSTIKMKFVGGVTVGRRMSVWFRSLQPVFKATIDNVPHEFWVGYYFCNGEVTGASLQATQVIYNRFGCCLRPYAAGKERHSGRDFAQRAAYLFERVVDREWNLQQYEEHFYRLREQSLGVVGTEEERAKQIRKLVEALSRRRGVPQKVATDFVHSALAVGADVKERQPYERMSGALIANRNGYDLFCALVRGAKQLGMDRREQVEMAAYEVFTGKIKF
jgi:hypothetical protein